MDFEEKSPVVAMKNLVAIDPCYKLLPKQQEKLEELYIRHDERAAKLKDLTFIEDEKTKEENNQGESKKRK